MRYPVFFTDGGVPKAGLSPVVTWRTLADGADPGTAPTVHELDASNAPGWYYFDADVVEAVVATVDGTDTLSGAERYQGLVLRPSDVPDRIKRVVYEAWDARGNPIAGRIELFASSTDEAAIQELSLAVGYDSANRPTSYTQG